MHRDFVLLLTSTEWELADDCLGLYYLHFKNGPICNLFIATVLSICNVLSFVYSLQKAHVFHMMKTVQILFSLQGMGLEIFVVFYKMQKGIHIAGSKKNH